MSGATASLRKKIGGAGDLQSVVRAMKAMAAANIGQYEKAERALDGYFHTVELGLSICFAQGAPLVSLTDDRGQAGKLAVAAVVFGSDQGLVGRFNDVVADHAIKSLGVFQGRPRIWAVGDRVRRRLMDAGFDVQGLFAVPGSVAAIVPLIGQILVAGEAVQHREDNDELYLFYNRPTSGAAYRPVSQRLLPLDESWRCKLAALPWPTAALPDIIGDNLVTLRALIREYLFVSLFRACALSLASENASRLAAMQRADKNIDDLLEELNATYRRLRQNGIDEELFDVVAGFEALHTEGTSDASL